MPADLTTAGVVYIAFGQKARAEATASIATLQVYHGLPVAVISDTPLPGVKARFIPCEERGAPGRWAKVNLDTLTPFEHTLYLDADTRVRGQLWAGFRLLELGADLVIVPSRPQRADGLRHLRAEERERTLDELPLDPLQLNTGVMWFDRERCAALFAAWRAEWQRWRDKDQGALLRALEHAPVAVRLLGFAFNDRNGRVVDHQFGACA